MSLAPCLSRLFSPFIYPTLIVLPMACARLYGLDAAFVVNDFAEPPQVSYPTALSAAANGDVYVSSDRNGSLGHAKGMGKIVRLRDTDGDGKADQFINFVPDVDSPRGGHMVGGTFYLIHPPYLSSYRDTNGDGVADENKQLVVGLGGGIEHPRGADHTTNSVRMGIDGWLYIAVGDFGMFNAKGTDGKQVILYGGGVARVRPDGSELETFAVMTRNIVDIAISPELDLFARDNTNDGKGWNTRFHHFTALGDHGYPRLYKNFANDAIKPLEDFGGGSGTGALWLQEPGFPSAFSNTLFTCDWTTGNIYHNPVTRENASFTVKQAEFLKVARAIDIDVDGFSRLYAADWRNGKFDHSKDGKPVGKIQRIICPKEKPAQYVDVTKAKDAELITLVGSLSTVQRMEASREILTRDSKLAPGLISLAKDTKQLLAGRIAAIFTYKQLLGKESTQALSELITDDALREYVLRAMTDRRTQLAGIPIKLYTDALKDANPRVVLQALIGLERLNDKTSAAAIFDAAPSWKDGGVSPRLFLTASTTLEHLANVEACMTALKTPATSALALHALAKLHRTDVVNGLIALAGTTKDRDLRFGVLGALARLTYDEKPWNLKSWWSTKPDDRGPYFEIIPWAATPNILAALEKGLAAISPDQQTAYMDLLTKNRVPVADLKLPGVDQVLVTAGLPKLDDNQVKLLVAAAVDPKRPFDQRVMCFNALKKKDNALGLAARIEVLAAWSKEAKIPTEATTLREDFINEAERGMQISDLRKIAAEKGGEYGRIAWASLLTVLKSPLAKDPWKQEVTKLVNENSQEVGFFLAISDLKLSGFDAQIEAALKSDKKELVAAAKAAQTQGAHAASSDKKVADLPIKDVASAAMAGKGNVETGKRLFSQQGCIACHATDLKAEQKGPFLGAAGAKFTRDYLVESVLEPSKVVAQGFQTFILTMKDGSQQMGFITSEIEGNIELRNIVGQVFKLKRAEVTKEDHLPQSMMPPGLANTLSVSDFTSLIDYLASLKEKGG